MEGSGDLSVFYKRFQGQTSANNGCQGLQIGVTTDKRGVPEGPEQQGPEALGKSCSNLGKRPAICAYEQSGNLADPATYRPLGDGRERGIVPRDAMTGRSLQRG